jgi:cation-transporting ATPase E/undecaprenyl-diphosphatase
MDADQSSQPGQSSVAATADTPERGLAEQEAARRLASREPSSRQSTSRSYASIFRANVFTVFNAILVVFGALTLIFGDWRDALFLGILVANTGIGIVQEVRAKRALDRLAMLVAPEGTVVRDGTPRSLPVEELVVGDLIRVEAGNQVVADGTIRSADGLLVDESVLTGESDAVSRSAGEKVRSGSFITEGSGEMVVEALGADSYAEQITGEAKRFRHPRSPLERSLDRLLFGLVGAVIVLGGLLGYALWHRQAAISNAVATATAGVVSLVPEGLLLLVSLTYAVGALRMARQGALSQQLNAIESLASVDVVCTDKTGTLTESTLRVVRLEADASSDSDSLAADLSRFAAASASQNSTLQAIADAYPSSEPVDASASVPFASRRGWSSVTVDDRILVLGAPERLKLGDLTDTASSEASAGRRVLGLVESRHPIDGDAEGAPQSTTPLGLVVLAEELRPQIRETVAFLRDEGIELKVFSGDSPDTVAAIAKDVGIDVSGPGIDGHDLPEDPDELLELAKRATVVGRISPEGKRRVVQALTDSGRYVAMIGDGVNDVPALKASRLAIAQGNGTQMAKSVADIVLVKGDFAVVPPMIAQGRRVLRNIRRVAKLYVTKSAFAAFLILMIGITSTAYPMLPRHFSLAATVTIGIPTFFLALAPSEGKWHSSNFVRDVLLFAVPTGVFAGLGSVTSYLIAINVLDLSLVESRTVATTALVLIGLYLIVVLEQAGWRGGKGILAMCAAMLALYATAFAIPAARDFFQIAVPNAKMVLAALGGTMIALLSLYLSGFAPTRPPARALVDALPVAEDDHSG